MDRYELDALMQKFQKGDEHAFEKIYLETKKGLFSFILSICKNYHTAEDLMQNTYIRVRDAINTYQPGGNALAWLYTIARNLTINELKRNKHEISSDFQLEQLSGSYNMDDSHNSPIFDIMDKVLSPDEKQLVTLHLISGFKHREIAEMCDKPLGTVLWGYRNALKKLKKYLETEGKNEL